MQQIRFVFRSTSCQCLLCSVTKAYYFLRSLYDQVYLAILSLYMKLLEYDSFVELQMWVNRVWVKFTSLFVLKRVVMHRLQYCWNEFFAPQIHFLSKHLSPLKKDSRALWKAIKTRDMQKIDRSRHCMWNLIVAVMRLRIVRSLEQWYASFPSVISYFLLLLCSFLLILQILLLLH